MNRTHRIAQLLSSLMAAGLLLAACAPPPTPAPTSVPPTAVPTVAPPTAAPAATATAAPAVLALQQLQDIAFDAEGNLYVADCGPGGARIFTVDSSGELTLFAGSSMGFSGDGGPALEAKFFCLPDISFDSAGNLYLLDWFNNRIRRIAPDGTISVVAGSGPSGDYLNINPAPTGFAGDGGPATEAVFGDPYAIALDQQDNLYILDRHNNRVRMVDQAGMITTIAGTGEKGFSGDGGPATAAELGVSNGLAVDAAGNVYISDTDGARIRRVDPDGIITTIAGTGEKGFSGDGGPAAEAQLSRPLALAVDAEGSLYFVDATSGTLETDRIRKIDADGTITTVTSAYHPDSPSGAEPYGVLNFDSAGNLYFGTGHLWFGYAGAVLNKIDQAGTTTIVLKGIVAAP